MHGAGDGDGGALMRQLCCGSVIPFTLTLAGQPLAMYVTDVVTVRAPAGVVCSVAPRCSANVATPPAVLVMVIGRPSASSVCETLPPFSVVTPVFRRALS